MVTPTVEGKDGKVHVESFHKAENAKVAVTLIDAQGNPVAKGEGKDVTVTIPDVHLWDGVEDPYLYTAVVELMKDGEVKDDVRIPFGVRTFSVDPKKDFPERTLLSSAWSIQTPGSEGNRKCINKRTPQRRYGIYP